MGENYMELIISASLILSVGMAVIALGILVWTFIRRRMRLDRGGVSAYLGATFFLFLSIIALRFSEFYYASYTGQCHVKGIVTGWEDLVASILASLRTFSMEEAYGDFLPNLREMMAAVYPDRSVLLALTVAFTTVLNILAPLAGGAIILELLANIFPKLKFLWARYGTNRVKAYFSELNPESLAMAKSLLIHYTEELEKRKPYIIFTDVYIDDESEKEYELLLEAKHIGAICLRDDLAHVAKRGWGKRSYFLMDQNEFGNLQTLTALSEERNLRYIRKAEIHLFVLSDAYVRLEQQINKHLSAYWESKKSYCRKQKRIQAQLSRIVKRLEALKISLEKSPSHKRIAQIKTSMLNYIRNQNETAKEKLDLKEKDLKHSIVEKKPIIIPVFGYRNLVLNLFSDVPLYEPLVRWENKNALRITILGSGSIGTEAFLNAYWMGQMMLCRQGKMIPCKLEINILSKESQEDFFSKLDYISPEIRASLDLDGSQKASTEDGDTPPKGEGRLYAQLRYTQKDIKSDTFWGSTKEEQRMLLDSDYLIVALGTDLDNISVAEKLRTLVGQEHLTDSKATDTVIAYAVFNSQLCDTLNEKKKPSQPKSTPAQTSQNPHDSKAAPLKARIYMHAFGSLEQVYSTDNVFLSESRVLAKEMGDAYFKQHNPYIAEHTNRAMDNNRNFTFWANISRVRHTKYKLFSLGWIRFSLFDPTETNSTVADKLENLSAQYRRIATLPPRSLNATDTLQYKDLEPKKHRLAWLEHRRWCAFTRTMGFQSTTALWENLQTQKSHKNMDLKLHPCLVEANCFEYKKGKESFIHGKFKDDGTLDNKSLLTETCDVSSLDTAFDPLDRLSYQWKKLLEDQKVYMEENDIKTKADDFKRYDYYRYEYNHCILLSDLLEWNKALRQRDGSPLLPHMEKNLLKLCDAKKKPSDVLPYSRSDGKDDYIIPISYAEKEISLTHRKIDRCNETNIVIAHALGRIPNTFDFLGDLYIPKSYDKEKKENTVLIIGDSYSTFGGFVPEGNKVYYAEIPTHDTDVLSVTDTWWYQVMAEGNFNLVLNESWSGAPVGYRGYDGEDCSETSSFIHRLRLMQERGFFRDNEIHNVFVFGGTNDSWCEAPLGEIKLSDWEERDLYCVLPAICCFFHELRQCLPEAKIYCLINTDLKDEITQALLLACKNHSMVPVTFPHIDKTNDHPTILGMQTIKDTVMTAIEEQSHG